MISKIRNIKIDWANHLVGFLSALFGIYIAFRLENVRENHQEEERIKTIERAIRNEVENNLRVYNQNIETLSDWLDYYSFCKAKLDNDGKLVIGTYDYHRIVKKHPTRFINLKMIKTLNDTLTVYEWNPIVDVAPTTGLSTSSWKAGIASGLLNSMDYTLVNNLSKIYDWTEKDIGTNEKDFYENMLGINTNNITNAEKLVLDYNAIVKTYSFKSERIQDIYDKIKWTD